MRLKACLRFFPLLKLIQKPPRIWALGSVGCSNRRPNPQRCWAAPAQTWLLVSSGFQQHLQLLQGSGLSGSLQLPTGFHSGLIHFYSSVSLAVGCFQRPGWCAVTLQIAKGPSAAECCEEPGSDSQLKPPVLCAVSTWWFSCLDRDVFWGTLSLNYFPVWCLLSSSKHRFTWCCWQ